MEVFPKLGYYFVVFRAIESTKTREKLRALQNPRDGPASAASPMEEAIVGEVNVYLIVFREGICSVRKPYLVDVAVLIVFVVPLFRHRGQVPLSVVNGACSMICRAC